MSKLGVFPGGAGTDNQYLSNLVFLNADTQAMGWWTSEPTMHKVLNDDDFTLDQAKKLFFYINSHMAHLMGDVCEPNCPAPWLNLGKLTQFAVDIYDSYDSIKTKAEMRDLLWSWFAYVNRLNSWFYTVFPWELGNNMRLNTPERLEKMASYYGIKFVRE